jgi:hypothetical protein
MWAYADVALLDIVERLNLREKRVLLATCRETSAAVRVAEAYGSDLHGQRVQARAFASFQTYQDSMIRIHLAIRRQSLRQAMGWLAVATIASPAARAARGMARRRSLAFGFTAMRQALPMPVVHHQTLLLRRCFDGFRV